LELGVFPDEPSRSHWHSKIEEERAERIKKYRAKMMGKVALWQAWREELPQGSRVAAAGFKRMEVWASFRDPDLKHSIHVARLAVRLYDGLVRIGEIVSPPDSPAIHDREILRAAALLHDVGRFRKEKGHHKVSYRLIRQMPPPLGWHEQDLQMAAIAARYHRGALPRTGQKSLRGLARPMKRQATILAGILRFADAFDAGRNGRIRKLELAHHQGTIVVAAEGYSPLDQLAESVAGGRHLLEVALRRPIIVRVRRSAGPEARKRALRHANAKARVLSFQPRPA